MHVVVGTAGHIDHGKSALVKALTGTDPDRLKEEKERGMTTDLGFAFLGTEITVIDVPGHERFVRHMLAGASTIDLVLLVVAADDGVMPQTREHFEICRLMGIRKGMVAINKADLVDDEWIEMVKLDVGEMVKGSFLEGAQMMSVSAITGQGVPELRQAIVDLAKKVEAKTDRGVFRMPVDRNFSMKGFGTVVAGTVLSGHVHVGDTLDLLPQKRDVRVRGIQRHNQMLETLGLGERAALNLQGVEREAVVRGNVLATPGYYTPTMNFNATFYLLRSVEKPLRNLARLKLHIGTAEVMCRVALLDTKEVAPGQEALVQVRAEEPVVCDWNDHYVIRTFAPQQTIGGGIVLEAHPSKERRFDEDLVKRLRALRTGEAGSVLEQYLLKHRFDAKTLAQGAKDLALADADAGEMLGLLVTTNRAQRLEFEGKEFLVHEKMVAEARAATLATLEQFHKENPLRLGLKRPELRSKAAPGFSAPLFEAVLAALLSEKQVVMEDDRVRLATHQIKLGPALQKEYSRIDKLFQEMGFSPPSFEEALAGVEKKLGQQVRVALLESGRLVDVGESVVLHRDAVALAEQKVRALFARKPELTASEIRQELGTTRKYLIPLLNYLDSRGITQRRGEVRVLRQKPA
ncbi:selenocysteine-specific translation elongation factor [candidate division WOR-3 bacterium]|uniref:Selenocysteine-specific elongation factor n=1 Tax=candidate division WOR-3 bacterium TaxID=2052148 RepID=A0A937XIP5_UNCW3|nr:selenocysteine-specific translation elongation factor [candidate division WOR-3 bacterium]